MNEEKVLEFPTRASWRKWLAENHDSEQAIWLLIYKQSSGKDWITYPEALEEALSYGWIDSRMKSIDSEKHIIRFSKRKSKAAWSTKNLRTVRSLIDTGKMTEHGMRYVPVDLEGEIERSMARDLETQKAPEELRYALVKEGLLEKFESMSPSFKRAYNYWITQARRPETRDRRVKEAIERIRRGEMPVDMSRWQREK